MSGKEIASRLFIALARGDVDAAMSLAAADATVCAMCGVAAPRAKLRCRASVNAWCCSGVRA